MYLYFVKKVKVMLNRKNCQIWFSINHRWRNKTWFFSTSWFNRCLVPSKLICFVSMVVALSWASEAMTNVVMTNERPPPTRRPHGLTASLILWPHCVTVGLKYLIGSRSSDFWLQIKTSWGGSFSFFSFCPQSICQWCGLYQCSMLYKWPRA